MALGVLYAAPAPTFEAGIHAQIAAAKAKAKSADLNALMRQGRIWTVG
jgi:hypothetical protein